MPLTTPNKFIDNPNQKTVTAVYQDGSNIIIQAMSYDNYINPPGYLDPTADINTTRQLLQQRVADYRSNLNTQLNG
jgi:hypothetical protein